MKAYMEYSYSFKLQVVSIDLLPIITIINPFIIALFVIVLQILLILYYRIMKATTK